MPFLFGPQSSSQPLKHEAQRGEVVMKMAVMIMEIVGNNRPLLSSEASPVFYI
jgi:hypothetical protein